MKKILFLMIFSCATSLFAQDMVLSIYNLKDPNYRLNEAQRSNIQSKLKGLLSENSVAAASAEGVIGLVPELILNEPRTVNAGMKNLTAYDGDLVVTAQQKDGKQIFGVYRKRVSGSGTNAALALSNLVNNIPNSDVKFAAFLKEMSPKINDFYNKNCAMVMSDAARLIDAGQMEAGISLLLNIPSTATCRGEADVKLKESYSRFREYVCNQSLMKAKAAAAAKDYAMAVANLKYIDPEAKCAGEANAFISEMQKNADSDMLAQLETVKEYFKALANQQNWQVVMMNDYMNRQ